MTGIFCHLPGLTSSSSERGSSAQELRLQRIPHRNIKIGWFPLHKVRVKDVTRPAIVNTAVLLPGSSGVVHQKSLPDDVPKGVMALDAERAQTTAQGMVPLWVNYLPAGATEGLGGGEELDAKPQPDSHAELLLEHGEAKKRVWKCPQPA